MKTIEVQQDVLDYLISKANTPGELPASILRRELEVPPPLTTLEVEDDIYAFIASKTEVVGESVSDILRREFHLTAGAPPAPSPPPPSPAPAPAPATVEFHLRRSGGSIWNDGSSMVMAKVGDTLRIVNDDTKAHRLHTTGRPFPHPASDILPGETADFVLRTTYNPSAEGPIPDHLEGTQAVLWIRVDPQL
jgi:SeqA protein N-terminal domain